MSVEQTFMQARDGLPLRCGCWRPASPGRVRGTVLLLAGRREYLEKYDETAGELCRRGFVVHSFDWRGQGLSGRMLADRRKGHVDTYDAYLADLCALLRQQVFPKLVKPLLIVAHSMGAHLALRLVHDAPRLCARLVLTSPMIAIQTKPLPSGLASRLVRAGLALGLAARAFPSWGSHRPGRRPFAGNPLTSDCGRFEREARLLAAQPPLVVGAATFGWLAATLRSMALLTSPGFAEGIGVPVLCVGAGADRIVSLQAQQRFCARLPRGEFVCVDQAQHELLQERDLLRGIFWNHFDRFCGLTG